MTTDDVLVLPAVPRPGPSAAVYRPVATVVAAPTMLEGAGFRVRRPFAEVAVELTDPFILLDQLGPVEYGPGEAKGAPWHPHRGFETVTYVMDGAIAHTDSNGGGGVITDGATQWMTAGAGILHDELPADGLVRSGGAFHGVQLWVNLPRTLKLVTPRYQDIGADRLRLLRSDDGGALLRLIAGSLAGVEGPGVTHTPITYVHTTLSPGARLAVPWRAEFNALAYALTGSGSAGTAERPLRAGELAVFGPGDALELRAGRSGPLDVLLLGGLPLREPVAWYGPFVMNTRAEILQAVEDFQAGRMGSIPATTLATGT